MANTGVRSWIVIDTASGQSLLTCADWTCLILSTRWATTVVLTRMSGRPAGICAAASTNARETCGPVPLTLTDRTTRNRDPSSAQATPARMAMTASPKNPARQLTCGRAARRDGPAWPPVPAGAGGSRSAGAPRAAAPRAAVGWGGR